jgi:hypothetical protein
MINANDTESKPKTRAYIKRQWCFGPGGMQNNVYDFGAPEVIGPFDCQVPSPETFRLLRMERTTKWRRHLSRCHNVIGWVFRRPRRQGVKSIVFWKRALYFPAHCRLYQRVVWAAYADAFVSHHVACQFGGRGYW